jgi:hypothetical protein
MRSLRSTLLGAAILTLLTGASGLVSQAQSGPPLDPLGASTWVGEYTDTQPPVLTLEPGDGRAEALGVASEGILRATDPRISGRWRQIMNVWDYESREPGGPGAMIWSASARIDNDEGAWVGTFTGFWDGSNGREWNILHGEGAYEGLTAVFRWLAEDSMQEGVIVPGDLPPLPDPIAP